VRAHAIVDLGKRSISCACGRVIRLSEAEAEGLKPQQVSDQLLDRHSDHVVSMKEQGRLR
jgi:hypothetical protein